MFEGKTVWQIFSMGGFTMYVLLLCSVLSLSVILERLIGFARLSRVSRQAFMAKIVAELAKGRRTLAAEICRTTEAPFARIALSVLEPGTAGKTPPAKVMEREIAVETARLEKGTGILGTIGNTAVYIGLFGTVLGVIRAFRDISAMGTGGLEAVIAGVAEALITTAAGLAVAVPAVIAYNYFVGRIERFVNEMELCASEMEDLLAE